MDNSYIRTDLAGESREAVDGAQLSGVRHSQHTVDGVLLSHIEITDEQAARVLQKPRGSYLTLSFEPLSHMAQTAQQALVALLGGQLRSMMDRVAPGASAVLVAGLGNRRITADALGPWTVDRITVTAHLRRLEPTLFEGLGQMEVSALAPGVLGDTGVEAASLIAKAAEAIKPDLVIVVDALAARSVERLGRTVQLSDAGIAPGSGVGNRRMALDRETLGLPVIAVGVPTVVHSATLVRDALSKAGIERIDPSLEQVLQSGESFFVTPKDCDQLLLSFADLLAQALDTAMEK